MAGITTRMLALDRIHLSKQGKRVFAYKVYLQSFKLYLKGEGNNVSLAHDKVWNDKPRLEGWDISEDPQPV